MGLTPLHYAVDGGHFQVVEVLIKSIQNVADKNVGDINGWTPLHVAALIGQRTLEPGKEGSRGFL